MSFAESLDVSGQDPEETNLQINGGEISISSESALKVLPTELYSIILEDLDYQSLLTCMQVSSLFRDLIVGTASLQYIIELAVAGQRDGSHCAASSATRLELLKKHQSSWNEVKWSREIRIPMREGGLWELYGGVLAQSTEEGTMVFNQLPSDLRAIEERKWTLGPDFGMTIRDFGMDPSQDLLVLIESPGWSLPDDALTYRIHLRTLSTGKPHPLAAHKPILSLLQTVRDLTVSYTIQISGNLLGVLFGPASAGENELAVWEWTTGSLLMDIASDDILSFSFLSGPWVLICDTSPALFAVNFRRESSERQDLLDITNPRVFEYPELDGPVFISDVDIRSDPGPISQSNSTAPFSQDATQFVFVVTLWLIVEGALRSLIHFIPSSHLLSLAESADDSSPTSFHWSDWIPGKTRLLFPSQYPSDIWVCYVHGAKFTISEPLPTGKSGYSARLFNLNRLALERGTSRAETSGAPTGIDMSTTFLKAGEAFREEVDTSLPFWSQTIALEDAHEHCTVLCSEDHIIIVDSECREYRVLVF